MKYNYLQTSPRETRPAHSAEARRQTWRAGGLARAGIYNSAYVELVFLAREIDVALAEDRDLPQAQGHFLYLPLEHGEALADQDESVRLIGRLDDNPTWANSAI